MVHVLIALLDNFRRLSAAVKTRKTAWINTWLYISCDQDQGFPALRCSGRPLSIVANEGFFRYWVSLLANKAQREQASDHVPRIPFTGIFVQVSGRHLI